MILRKFLIINFILSVSILFSQNADSVIKTDSFPSPINITARKIFIHADYQFLKYDYFQIGIGFNPKNHRVLINRNNESFAFLGYRFGYSKNLNNSDWGLNAQSIALQGHYGGFTGIGMEINYKSIKKINHFGFKPLVGFAFPNWNLMYGYNFDFYKEKSQRISQHEIILGVNLQIFKWK
jgi:hypothetical protein